MKAHVSQDLASLVIYVIIQGHKPHDQMFFSGVCKTQINGSADHGLRCERGLESHPLLTAFSCSLTCFSLLKGRTWCNKYFPCRIVCLFVIHCKMGIVKSTSHLLSKFQVSEHIT